MSLEQVLADKDVAMLIVTDRGTRGLCGPTRADLASDEYNDFVAFVRNSGRAEGKMLGGGTYGFGKGVLYDASVASTIMVFTRTSSAGRPVTRFMAIGMGSPFIAKGRHYTGRHWWGAASSVTGVEPVTGARAVALARGAGMMTIPEGATGTAIAVIAPVAHDEEVAEDIVQRIADAATWWAWPHMVGNGDGPTIAFSFSNDGKTLVAPDPSKHPVLRHHVAAYPKALAVLDGNKVAGGWPWTAMEIRSARPKRRLGALVHRKFPAEQAGIAPGQNPPADLSHISLMRNPRLIVQYMPVPPDVNGQLTAGVFVVPPELDRDFALSEPVAHDEWVPGYLELEKFGRNPVKQALDRLKAELRSASDNGGVPVQTPGGLTGVARLATVMGDLLEGQPGGIDAGTSVPPGKAAGSGFSPGGKTGGAPGRGSRGRGVQMQGEPELLLLKGTAIAQFNMTTLVAEGHAVRLVATPHVLVDGGAAEKPDDPPLGSEVPVVTGWIVDGSPAAPGATLELSQTGQHEVAVRITQPQDAAVTVHISYEESP